MTPLPDALRGVTVTPTSGSVLVGQTLSLVSVADAVSASVGVSYAYSTTSTAVATVSQNGVVSGVAPGSAVITVTATGSGVGYATTLKSATSSLTVTALPNALNSVTLSPTDGSVPVGQALALTPTPDRANASVAMSYSYQSNAPGVATVTQQGVVTGVAPGNAVITVTATGSLVGFTTTQRTATAAITVTNAPNALNAVTLSPANGSVAVGQSLTLTPTPDRANTSVLMSYTYQSNATNVATVNQAGVVTGVAQGSATITVTATGSLVGFTTTQRTATAAITVTPAPNALNSVTLSPASGSVPVGQALALTPTPDRANASVAMSYSYQSNAPGVATVTQQGVVTGVAPGNAVITVTATGSLVGFTTTQRTATAAITVTNAPNALNAVTLSPANGSVAVGQSLTLTPTPDRANTSVLMSYTYQSNATNVATVNQAGVVTGVAQGSATITVTATGSLVGFTTTQRTATAAITVTPAPNALNSVTLSPASGSVPVGQALALTPTPDRASPSVFVSYAYQSSATNIATVNQVGVVTGVAPGNATITVTATGSLAGFTTTQRTATAAITVTTIPNALLGMTVTPASVAVSIAGIAQLTPNVVRTHPSVSFSLTYTTSAPAIAAVNSSGVVTGVSPGSATVSVTATGSGAGYQTNQIVVNVPVTVATCSIVAATLPISFSGQLSPTDCASFIGTGTAKYFSVNLTTQTAVLLSSGGVHPVSAYPSGQTSNVYYPGGSGRYLFPAGTAIFATGSATLSTIGFTFSVTATSEDVDGCGSIVLYSPISSSQNLLTTDCQPGSGNEYDRFDLFLPGRSCTINVLRTGATPIGDPYLEVWTSDNGSLFDQDDDGGGALQSRLVLNPCTDPAGSIVRVRVRAFGSADYGSYTISVSSAQSSNSATAAVIRSGKLASRASSKKRPSLAGQRTVPKSIDLPFVPTATAIGRQPPIPPQ
ncbi:MAG: Ig-like domain-containing protein [Gemmatimonas sp.]